ncbi:MAG: YqaA family protein [Thermogutta sp.]
MRPPRELSSPSSSVANYPGGSEESSGPSERAPVSPKRLEADAAEPKKRGHLLRRLYDWVLHWADTPYGTPALFVLAFAESSFFPVPPDVLQIALSVSKPRRSFYYAAVSGVGSVLGGILGYLIGLVFWSVVGGFFIRYVPGLTPENIDYVGKLYEQNAFWAIVGAGFTPIPYKVFTIAAGIFHEYISLGVLVAGSVVGRFGRFFLVAACLYFFGPGVKSLIEKYFDWAALALAALAILGFVAIKWLM